LRPVLNHKKRRRVVTGNARPPLVPMTLSKLRVDTSSIANAYDRYARVYDLVFGAVLQDGRRKTVAAMQVAPGQRVAELGVGSGLMLPLYPAGTPVVAIDISHDMLERARAKVTRLGLRNIDLQLADAQATGLPADAFDHVVLPYIYSVTPDPAALMQECFRICKPGGSIWILNHFSGLGALDSLNWLIKPVANALRFHADFSYQEYVANQGWQVQQVIKANALGLSRVVQVKKT
jgi:phosphatidylethanolamine/phosphatidyl-N-methylethanolamine N-methyltransferase